VRIQSLKFELEIPGNSRGAISFSIAILLTTFFLLSGKTATAQVKTSSLGEFSPTFVGPAATGCKHHCSLLTGPFSVPAIAPISAGNPGSSNPSAGAPSGHIAKSVPAPTIQRNGPDPAPPSVSCQPAGPGCETISSTSGGAIGVKGLNAVDMGNTLTAVGAPFTDVEPSDQGLCAGNGYVVESNNVGEVLIFNTSLQRESEVIALDSVMGLGSRGWSSGGDISCLYDHDNGGHWFFTEFVSASTEASGGPFSGCFVAVPSTCYEGIAVTVGSDPFGPYNVYFLNANYNPAEPGYPSLLNDFAKIAVTRDAFLLFYDEFPQDPTKPGIGGGGFNGAQEFAFSKKAFELGLPVTRGDGDTNPAFTVAIENMGLLPTPDGTCASDNTFGLPGFTCWYSVIPAMPPDPSQYDNSRGGSGFMLETLDFYGSGDTRVAVFDWTGLENLNNRDCEEECGIRFGGQLFSGVNFYYDPGLRGAQKAGPIPLGDECGAAGLSVAPDKTTPPPASCPEGGIAGNGDNFTQASQAQGQLWGAASTAIAQKYASEASPEVHLGSVYWVINTAGFNKSQGFTLTSQGYVSAEHEDMEFPAMAAEGSASQDGGNGGAILAFTLSGNGGPTGVHHGGYYPSTAYGRLTSTSGDLLGSVINIADMGEAPQDGFTEYQGYPGPTGPRWGDYSYAIFLPNSGGKIYFSTGYIQHRNCSGDDFTLTVGTCDGTRDGNANWGTSVNYVVP
jgi:hypothetical protein